MIRLIPQVSEAVLIGTTISRYRLVGRLAKGGMGEVYEAEDSVFPRRVALKFLAAETVTDVRIRERFQREIQALSSLNHRNICVVYDAGEYEGRPYLVMERLEGKTLADELVRTPLDVDELLSIGIQICEGLGAAHGSGIIHRDIKPSNVMLTSGNQVKILDFGLAKIRPPCKPECESSTASTEDSLTDRGALVGTLPYMAPEQALGKPLDVRCDLFSLGVVLYELATGTHPFRGETVAAVCEALLRKQPAPPLRLNPALPVEFDGLLRKALEKDPRHRFQSAADFAAELRRIRYNREVETAALQAPPPRPKRGLGAWLRYLVLSICAVLVLVLGVPEAVQWVSNRLGEAALGEATTAAVLPFELIGDAAGRQRDFCEGVSRDLSILLQQQDGSRPRLMVSSYRLVRDVALRDLYRERGVELAVSGNLTQEGEKLIVRISLVDTRRGTSSGGERIEGTTFDRNGLARKIEEAVLRMLQLKLRPDSRSVLAAGQLEGAPDLRGVMLEGQGLLERYDDQGHVEDAISKFSEVTQRAPEYAPAYSSLGLAYAYLYRHVRRPELVVQANDAARRALQLDPKDPAGTLTLGMVLSEFGRYEEALSVFDQSLKLSPERSEAWRWKAAALAHLGRSAEAEQAYRKAIELHPHYWAGYHELGSFLLDLGRYEEALREFERVEALLPESVTARNNIAVVQLRRQQPSLAEAVLEGALKLRPTFQTFDLLGSCFYEQGDYAKAAESYEEALKLDDSQALVWGNLGGCYRQLGRPDDVARCYRRAADLVRRHVEVNPNDATATLNLADYLIEAGDREQGRYYLGEALKLPASTSDPEFMFVAAQIFEGLNDRESAITWVLRALGAGFPRARVEESPSLSHLVADPKFRLRLEDAEGSASPGAQAQQREKK